MRYVLALAGATAFFGVEMSASAALVAPNGTAMLQAETQSPGPAPVDHLTASFSVFAELVGTVDSWVVAGDPTNPFGNGLSFYYQVVSTGTEPIDRFTAANFTGFSVDAERISLGAAWEGALLGGSTPILAGRSADGKTVGFDFLTNTAGAQIPGGGWSEILVLHTNAPRYVVGRGAVIDSIAANVELLSPVPEPRILAAIAMAGLALGMRRRRA